MEKQAELIILTYNKSVYTRYCLDGILKSTYRPLRVIMVDNGSTDETPEVIREFREKAAAESIDTDVSFNSENIGAVRGRNIALQRLTGGITVFMDNDVVPSVRNWLETLLNTFESHPDAGAVSPKLIYPDTDHRIQCAGCDVSPTGKVNFRGRGLPRDEAGFNTEQKVQALITACMAVPFEIIQRVGLFDTQFHPVQFEDIDYCYRIKELGYHLYYSPVPELYHFENVTTSRSKSLNSAYNTVKNGMKFKKKWKNVFSGENGPPESEMKWLDIEPVHFSDIREDVFNI